MKQDKIIKKVEGKFRESKIAETILNIFKIGLSVTKYGAFSNLISEFIPSRRFLRLEKFAEELAEDLKKFEDKIDTNFITTDEFAFMFEQCFKAATENYQKEKLESFKAIIINSIINDRIENYEREFFLILTNSLTVLHIKILKFLCYPHKYLADNNISESLITGDFRRFIPKIFEGIMIGTIMMAFDDLYKYGLIKINSENIKNIKTSNIFITSESGFELLDDTVTEYGAQYYGYITTDRIN